MKKTFLLALICSLTALAGCNDDGQMNMQDMTNNMAHDESVQRAFSDGRIDVMNKDEQTKRSILQNTMDEQNMMMNDPQLSEQFVELNINTNRMMTSSPKGQEQLKQSTLTVLDGINQDFNELRSLTRIQAASRRQAVTDAELRNVILQQNVQEQALALNHAATSQNVKELSLKTTSAIMNDNVLRTSLLKQNVQAFGGITGTPALRSEMATAMLPLLKDPKIAAELEKMIQTAVAKEAQKMQAEMKAKMQQMQQQMQQMRQEVPQQTEQAAPQKRPPQQPQNQPPQQQEPEQQQSAQQQRPQKQQPAQRQGPADPQSNANHEASTAAAQQVAGED
ncbi:hypothetical protein [Paenibacillus xerothermodurans]|uniref:Uncharacterized protein n=1 Tax=Paenibacillus xerothermodurans TaxID=1977292 RepID=A0A2W1NV96_PAEXE|nr:hypothetical protein [Paenibacillus xerothermodurans]PZE21686.1 hypothetical protein CBW46_004500 [Paenibacillus xerothermodurans]